MRRIKTYLIILIILVISTITQGYSFETNSLKILLKEEIRKSSIGKDVNIGDIKFIGFAPTENCMPERIKIREIKRSHTVEFTFYCGIRQYRALANYEVLVSVYLPQRNLKRGDTLNEEDFIEIKRPAQKIPAGAITKKDEIIGRVLKRTVAQGIILKEDHLYSGIPVKRGSYVRVMITSGQVTILTEGVLKYDSAVGERAKVQCFQTGKEIVGELVDKDKLRVML